MRFSILLPLSLLLSLSACINDAPFKQAPGSYAPELLNDGWTIGDATDLGLSDEHLRNIQSMLHDEENFFNTKSLLVVKDGKLVFESYIQSDEDRDHVGHLQSITKSITSLTFGILRSEGYFSDLDQPLYELIPNDFPNDASKRSITIRHLLTMRSGLDIDNDIFSVEIYVKKPDNPARYILDLPLYDDPGARFYYRDCDPHLLSYTIGQVTGRSTESWAAEKIFEPLGIEDYYWGSDVQGTSMGGHGLHLRPRDLAKIGQLVLDNGRWNGEQVVDSSWVASSTQLQISTPDDYSWDYGYYWWRLNEYDGYSAWGHGGSFITVIPSKNIVLVLTSMPDTNDELVGTTLDKFIGLIRPLLDSITS